MTQHVLLCPRPCEIEDVITRGVCATIRYVDGMTAVTLPHRTLVYNSSGLLNTEWRFLNHRVDGPAIEDRFSEQWYRNGRLHRVGGPAVTDRFSEQWYLDGLCHRDDGPAIEYKDGLPPRWFHHGRETTEDDHALLNPEGHRKWFNRTHVPVYKSRRVRTNETKQRGPFENI